MLNAQAVKLVNEVQEDEKAFGEALQAIIGLVQSMQKAMQQR